MLPASADGNAYSSGKKKGRPNAPRGASRGKGGGKNAEQERADPRKSTEARRGRTEKDIFPLGSLWMHDSAVD